MRPVQSLLLRISRRSTLYVLHQPSMQSIQDQLTRTAMEPHQQRRYVQQVDEVHRNTTALQSMKEFFMHPLTWDRNNGFLNVVLAISIFGLCFINSCSPCPDDMPASQLKKDE